MTNRSCDSVCDWRRGRFDGSPKRHDEGDESDEDGGPGGAGTQWLGQAWVAVSQVTDGAEEQDAGDDQEQDDEQGERGHGGFFGRLGALRVSAEGNSPAWRAVDRVLARIRLSALRALERRGFANA